jgi:hypothetical protein
MLRPSRIAGGYSPAPCPYHRSRITLRLFGRTSAISSSLQLTKRSTTPINGRVDGLDRREVRVVDHPRDASARCAE